MRLPDRCLAFDRGRKRNIWNDLDVPPLDWTLVDALRPPPTSATARLKYYAGADLRSCLDLPPLPQSKNKKKLTITFGRKITIRCSDLNASGKHLPLAFSAIIFLDLQLAYKVGDGKFGQRCFFHDLTTKPLDYQPTEHPRCHHERILFCREIQNIQHTAPGEQNQPTKWCREKDPFEWPKRERWKSMDTAKVKQCCNSRKRMIIDLLCSVSLRC